MRFSRYHLRAVLSGALVCVLPVMGCNSVKDELLDAPDPDIINPGDIQSPEGADALRVGAFTRLRLITAGSESAWLYGGLLTDEWKSSDTFSQRNETDQRGIQLNNANIQTMYRDIPRAWNSAHEAIALLQKFPPKYTNANWGVAQMYFVMGFAELTIAENFCNGTPISDASTGTLTYGDPMTNAQVLALAVVHLDSAINLTRTFTTDTASQNVLMEATVAKGRAQIDLGQFTEAAATVAAVPTSFRFNGTFSLTGGNNQIWSLATSAKRYTVSDSFDATGVIKNAIPFASAGDPRVPVQGSTLGTSAAGKGFDTNTNLVIQLLWGRTDPTPIVSGVDARLIEAEERLRANDFQKMTDILDTLRRNPQMLGASNRNSPVMALLAVPPDAASARDLFFREKAFWQFSRGFRLNDMRRQLRQYGRTQDQVFPIGNFFKNGTYGADVNMPVTTDELNNPKFHGCLDRNP